jgi:hypothetical protein
MATGAVRASKEEKAGRIGCSGRIPRDNCQLVVRGQGRWFRLEKSQVVEIVELPSFCGIEMTLPRALPAKPSSRS